MIHKEVIIIGAGPTGLVCGIEAQKAGLDYLILEKGLLVNSLYNFPTNMTFFSTSSLLEIGDVPFISHHDKPTRAESLEYYRRLVSSYDLQINYREKMLDLKAHKKGGYILNTSKTKYHCQNLILAIGFYDVPNLLNVPGEELPKVKHYYDDAHKYIGQKVLVIGAANSACDVALETYQKGAEVSMAVRKETLYKKVKYWIKPNIENRIKEGSITAYFNTTVKEIKEGEVVLMGPKGTFSIENDHVLAMTGYQPDFSFLENLGIKFEGENKIPVYNELTLESNMPNVYLAGVILAGKQTSKLFIENTRDHGKMIIRAIGEANKQKIK